MGLFVLSCPCFLPLAAKYAMSPMWATYGIECIVSKLWVSILQSSALVSVIVVLYQPPVNITSQHPAAESLSHFTVTVSVALFQALHCSFVWPLRSWRTGSMALRLYCGQIWINFMTSEECSSHHAVIRQRVLQSFTLMTTRAFSLNIGKVIFWAQVCKRQPSTSSFVCVCVCVCV